MGIYFSDYTEKTFWIVMAFLLPHLATAVLFYVNGRLRVPLLYFLSIFVGTSVVRLWQMIRSRDSSIWLTLLCIMGLSAVVGYQSEGVIRHARIETPAFYATARGMAAIKKQDINAAENLFLFAVETHPLGAREAWTYLAELYRKRGLMARWEECSQRASGVWPLDLLDQFVQEGRVEQYEYEIARARSLWSDNKQSEALSLFIDLTKRYPDHPEAWFNAAAIVSGTNTQWKQVAKYCGTALDRGMKLSLDSGRAHRLRIKAFEQTNDINALEAARKQLAWENSLTFIP
jgi:hypothetical protein